MVWEGPVEESSSASGGVRKQREKGKGSQGRHILPGHALSHPSPSARTHLPPVTIQSFQTSMD